MSPAARAARRLVRFWKFVEPEPNSGCWLWLGAWSNADRENRYGQYLGRSAHRHAYELFVGPIPLGLLIRHRCDTAACVNPAHLLVGTHAENMADMSSRDRNARVPRAVVEEILALGETLSRAAIARRFGVSPGHVSRLVRGHRRRVA